MYTPHHAPDPVPPRSAQSGFTLVEVAIATLLFTLVGFGVSRMTMSNFEISHLNVYQTTAMSVAQGYLEQIKSLDNETIARMATLEVSGPVSIEQVLPTRSVSLMSMGASADQIDDWLVSNTANTAALSNSFDVVNHKEVIVDFDQSSGEFKTMDIWIDVEIFHLGGVSGDSTYLIDVQYIYSMPGMRGGTKKTRTAYVRTGSNAYTTATRSIVHKAGVNEGRLQLLTTLMNFESL